MVGFFMLYFLTLRSSFSSVRWRPDWLVPRTGLP
jgi:hypothetical protein